jgi:hypothetical protein
MSNVVIYNLEEYKAIGATKWMTTLASDFGLTTVRSNKQTKQYKKQARHFLSWCGFKARA